MSKGKVIVGMSGGVDSSVAAYLLQKAGFEVEGLFMKNWEEDDGTEYCTAIQDLEDAQQVAERLRIPLRTANFSAEYWDHVFEDFLADYRAGYTPNPDVLCNREIKFKHFANYARTLGAQYIATGHYVRWLGDGAQSNDRAIDAGAGQVLGKGRDPGKDQSYFLQAVPRQAFDNCLFPLGDLMKTEVRQIAADAGLHNHKRKDSTGICFIGERRFQDFLARYIAGRHGRIVDTEGRTLGEHSGLHNFTIGQRQGLQIGGVANRPEAPWYVVGKHGPSERLVVSQDVTYLSSDWLRASEPNWLIPPKLPHRCTAKIRHRQEDQSCRISAAADGSLLIEFSTPQRAVACGQYVALYDGDALIGGAKITTSTNTAFHLNF